MIRVAVTGGRDFLDRAHVYGVLEAVHKARGIAILMAGDARGADALALAWARLRGVNWISFRAAWERHGRAAGPIRNRQILELGKPDLLVAFPGGRGTADMIGQAYRAGVELFRAVAL